MKQLILIISIALYLNTNVFSQSYFIDGKVDFYVLLDIPREVVEEEYFAKLDTFFRKCGVSKGYESWQLYDYDPKTGTFSIVEFFKEGQPIGMGQGDWYNDLDFTDIKYHKEPQKKK
jgi:hypothetical protein